MPEETILHSDHVPHTQREVAVASRVKPRRWWLARRGFILLILVLGLLICGAFLLDGPVCAWVAENQKPEWKRVATVCSRVGDWPPMAIAAVVLFAGARLQRNRRLMNLACLMLAATVLAGAVVNPARALTGRARPNAKVVKGWHGMRDGSGKWIAGKHAYSAFPSAHTTVAAAFIAPLVLLGWRVLASAWIGVLLVAWSRVYLHVHHPSDVMVGMIAGWACAMVLCHSAVVRWWLWRAMSVLCGKRRAWPAGKHAWLLPLGASQTLAE